MSRPRGRGRKQAGQAERNSRRSGEREDEPEEQPRRRKRKQTGQAERKRERHSEREDRSEEQPDWSGDEGDRRENPQDASSCTGKSSLAVSSPGESDEAVVTACTLVPKDATASHTAQQEQQHILMASHPKALSPAPPPPPPPQPPTMPPSDWVAATRFGPVK